MAGHSTSGDMPAAARHQRHGPSAAVHSAKVASSSKMSMLAAADLQAEQLQLAFNVYITWP